MNHPSSIALEAFACGDEAKAVATHLEACDACRLFVEKARALVSAERAADDGDEAVARAVARHAGDAGRAKRPVWFLASSIAAPLAAAAAVLLLARGTPAPRVDPTDTPAPPATSPGIVATAPIAAQPSSGEPETTFKGSVQLAVVRERGGDQARFAEVVSVRSGDRIRVEVALDREQAILGAVLADDGSYLELMPAGVRGPGTHYSEKSARIDATPTKGTIVIGSPEAVLRARATGRLEGVVTLRVEPEASPW